MATSTNVRPLPDRKNIDNSTSSSKPLSSSLRITFEDEHQNKNVRYSEISISSMEAPISSARSGQAIPINDLYPAIDESSSLFASALPALSSSIKYFDQALDSMDSDDAISADQAVQRAQALLPELFCLRRIGDGFGLVISAVDSAISNKQGLPLSRDEVASLKRALSEIKERPFLKIDQAVDLTMVLEDRGLNVELPELNRLAEEFSD